MDSVDTQDSGDTAFKDHCAKMAAMPREHRLPVEKVTEDLRRRIDAGEWEPGEQLPSTAALADHYEVSRALVGKVIQALAGEGKLVTRPRWGAFMPGEAAGSR